MKKTNLFVLGALLLQPLHSLAGTNDFESIGEPKTLWTKKTLKVCWGGYADVNRTHAVSQMSEDELNDLIASSLLIQFDQESRSIVQSIIQQEYNTASIGITFTGWKACTPDDRSDVVLFGIKESPHFFMNLDQAFSADLPIGQATIGKGGQYHYSSRTWTRSDSPLKSFVFLRHVEDSSRLVISTQNALRLTALHEFGHLLGLRHEHARKEANDDVNCDEGGVRLGEAVDASTRAYGVYDPNSIMSYCHIYMLKYRSGMDFVVKGPQAASSKQDLSKLKWKYTLMDYRDVNFTDPKVVTKTTLSGYVGMTRFQVAPKLSSGDLHTLRCMYGFYSADLSKKTCVSSFRPY